jgi:hypothetical protein
MITFIKNIMHLMLVWPCLLNICKVSMLQIRSFCIINILRCLQLLEEENPVQIYLNN